MPALVRHETTEHRSRCLDALDTQYLRLSPDAETLQLEWGNASDVHDE